MEELPLDNSNVKNISFGIEGILVGFLFFILVLIGFNYFRIISLSSFYSKLSILPQKELSVEEKAQKAGYSVAWVGDTEDGSGRTILASKDRARNIGFPDGFGYLNHRTAVIGIFKSFEKISSSNDLYIILENPINKEQIKIRISTEARFLDETTAQFLVDNLQLITSKNISSIEQFLDYSGSEDNLQKIKKVIKPGDIIYAGLYTVLIADKGEIKDADITRDRNGIAYADVVVLRRFEGKEQIDKELAL